MKLIDAIDFQKNEAQNLRLQNLGADIGTPVDGLIFYRSDTDKVRVYINGSWEDLATMDDVTAGGISVSLVDAKGDLLVGTGADAIDNLAVGANGTVLVAASGETTGLQWRVLTEADINLSATDKLVGRDTAAAGVAEEIGVTGGIEFDGSGNIRTTAFTGDVTKTAGGTALTIPNDTVTYAKMQNVSTTDRLLGRDTAGAGDVEELTATGGLEFTGTGIQTSAFTGEVTKAAGGTALTIANAAVTLAKMANLAANSFIGNNTGSAATPIALTTAQAKTLLAIVAADVSDFHTAVRTNRLDQMAAPTASVALNSQKITGLADGTAANDAATFGQVNAIVQGQDWKNDPADAATTAALPAVTATTTTLTAQSNGALAAQDGVTLAVGDTLVVKNQAAGAQNGIYTVTQAGNAGQPFILTRRADADTAAELTDATIFVDAGTVNVGRIYTFPTIATLGTTDATPALTGSQPTAYTADETTLTLTGTQFAVKAAGISNTHISGSAAIAYSKLALSNSIVNADIATAAAIAYSKLNLAGSLKAADVDATAVASGSGTVRVTRTYAQALTGGATSEVINHPLNTRDVHVDIINNSSPWDAVMATWEATSTGSVTIRSSQNLPAGYRVVITG